MTVSKALIALLTHLRRTLARVFRKSGIAVTLTLSLPPFIKLEIKSEPRKEKPSA